MQIPIFALACCLMVSAALAYPQLNPFPREDERLELSGGHNRDKYGQDVHIEGRVPVWTSDNRRHEVDVQGYYGQHLGGPWGNSPPSWQVGPTYRYRFPGK